MEDSHARPLGSEGRTLIKRRLTVETYDHRKPRSLWLTALVALVVLILVSWWLLGRANWSRAPITESSGVVDVAEPALPTAVNAYIQFVESTRARDAMAVDHEFTATGIGNLTAALESIAAAGGPDVQSELAALREQAGALQQDARSMDHADRTRAMFVSLSGLVTAIQVARFPSLQSDVADVKRAAEQVDPALPLLEQSAAVQTFFDRAAAVVRRMSGGGTA